MKHVQSLTWQKNLNLTEKGPPKICHTYPTTMKLGIVIPYISKIQKIHNVTQPLSSPDISIFYRKSVNFAISRNTDIDCILIDNFYFFNFSWDCFNKHEYNSDDASKNGYPRPS